jgi:hypothetical protein
MNQPLNNRSLSSVALILAADDDNYDGDITKYLENGE